MNLFTRVTNMIKMVLAFRDCGLINAWRMAMETNEMIRLAVVVPYPIEVVEGEVVEEEPYLLAAPQEES